MQETDQEQARPLARDIARELSPAEIEEISGGKAYRTRATGPNGDDPSDPDW